MGFSYVIYDWMNLQLSGAARDVYAIIYAFSRSQCGCYYGGVQKLAEVINTTDRTIRSALRQLEEQGWILRTEGQHGRGHTDDYVTLCEGGSKMYPDTPEKGEIISAFIPEKGGNNFREKGKFDAQKGEIISANNKPKENINKPYSARDARACEKFGEFVSMTEDEHGRLVAQYGEEKTKALIEMLDNYKGSTGKTYRNDYRAILSWVVDRYEEQQRRQPAKRETSPAATIAAPRDIGIYNDPDFLNSIK